MNHSEERFAQFLTEAIYDIKQLESKKIAIIQDELGYALGKKGGASIEYWRKGNLPRKTADIAQLAREITQRIPTDAHWLRTFCQLTNYPHTEALLEELFPTPLLPIDEIPQPAPLPSGSHMPLIRNPFFVGRIWDLKALAQTLRAEKVAAVNQVRIAAATGMGGMGKTQLASEFVHRYGQYFPGGVFWINFEDPEAVPAKIAECGSIARLNLSPQFADLSVKEQVQLVQNEWQKPTLRLLIFDNCEDEALLARWIPKTGGCRILVTSRRSTWDPVLKVKMLSLGVLYGHESIQLLQQLSEIDDENVLGQIADELGYLPLALHLAGKYLYQYKKIVSPATYLRELQNPDLLQHRSLQSRGISPTNHPQHVWRTFALSYEKLLSDREVDIIAQELLVGAAHFAPGEPIWRDLLVKTIHAYPHDPLIALKAEDSFQRLLELGLIEIESNNLYRMHRLIAAFVQTVATEQMQATLEKVEQVVFEETAKINQVGYPVPLLAWHLHLRSVTDLAKVRQDERAAKLCQAMGEHLRQMGNFEGAFSYFKRALQIWQEAAEPSADLTYCLFKLGHLHREIGELEEAKRFLDEALALRLTLFGKNHPHISECHNEIGRWFYQKHDLEAAHDHFDQAITICRNTLGESHRFTAEYINNLGMCLYGLGKMDVALSQLRRALTIRREVLGERHPETALSFNNVGFLLRDMGQLQEAQGFYEQALHIRETVLGDKHPRTAETYNNLGDILLRQNKTEQVSTYLEKSVAAFEHSYGRFHPSLAFPLRNLGLLRQQRGSQEKAIPYFKRALHIREKALGNNHPLTGLLRRDLGLG